jgi:hypothetical protein
LLIERPLSLTTTAIAVALIVPECSALLSQPGRSPRMIVLIASLIGSIGISFCSAVSSTFSSRSGRVVRLVLWGIVAVGLGLCVGFCMLKAREFWMRLLFTGAAVLPLLAYLRILFHLRQEAKPLPGFPKP